jgi:hypothetical protein
MQLRNPLITLIAALLILSGCARKQSEEEKKAEIQAAVKQALEDEKKKAANPGAADAQSPDAKAGDAKAEAAKAAEPAAATPATPPPPPPPRTATVAAGTTLSVRTTNSMSTKNSQAGNRFEATLEQPLIVDGWTLAKKGALVEGVVADASQGGRVKGKAELSVRLDSLHLADGRVVKISTGAIAQQAKSGTKKDLVRGGIMTGAGAAIGAIAGGGRGAAIGAGVGAGAGVGTAMATKGPAAEIPAEALMSFRLSAPLTVTEKR